ncbi:response regulator transcription factor [Lacrimispora aerotolerans]|jgi:DNA-binding response OmpR family regulator|uniref:response regulator transcription factor n=1 Tax=Lacrimispora aerotolerans TaxID=36832 RepID=UPI000479FC36|nr:response regulator transcription factor [Lacrimispora aerotolerans]
MKVLIVEDEIRLADALGQIMKEQNYHTDIVNDGTDGLYYGLSNEYDVIILDVMLPGMNGFQIVQKLRESRIKTPVLLLTARDDTSDKVKGLDKGADDYLTKPFIPEELLARIRALSRRQGDVFLDEMVFGDLSLDLSSNDLCCREKSIHLAFKEFEVLKLLMSNSGKIISKDTLIARVWGNDSDAEDNNVEAYISFLRKKLSFVGSQVEINTIRKVGYRLEGPR